MGTEVGVARAEVSLRLHILLYAPGGCVLSPMTLKPRDQGSRRPL